MKKGSSWFKHNKKIWPYLERPSTLSGVKNQDQFENMEIKFDDYKTNKKQSYNLDKEGGNDEQSKATSMLYFSDLIIYLERSEGH